MHKVPALTQLTLKSLSPCLSTSACTGAIGSINAGTRAPLIPKTKGAGANAMTNLANQKGRPLGAAASVWTVEGQVEVTGEDCDDDDDDDEVAAAVVVIEAFCGLYVG